MSGYYDNDAPLSFIATACYGLSLLSTDVTDNLLCQNPL